MILNKLKNKAKILIVIVILGFGSGIYLSFDEDSFDFEVTKNLDIYYTLFRELNLFYVDQTDPGKLIKTSIDEMLKSLDPYTVYIPESRMEDYKLMTTGQYGGIGALIRKSDDFVVISEPYEGFPAYKAGLKAGDKILEIDGKSIKGMSTSDVSEILKGQPSTNLSLLIKRYGEEQPITRELTREEIQIKNVPYSGMITDSIGYIRLTNFTRDAYTNVKKAFTELNEKKASSIILDLRGNPGGLLIESVKISNIFLDKGKEVVSTKGKVKQWDKTYQTMFAGGDTEIPVIVLVNNSSASASEIVAGAMQDLDRGVIIGQRTYGKGLVQTTRELSYNSKLKITTAKYYIPSGRCIQALDYTHRNEDGSVGEIPDSLISEFSTTGGRKVYDGGGIMPDIQIEPQKISKITTSLYIKNLIFDYANKYEYEHDSIAPVSEYEFTDAEYDEFVAFLADKNFDYETRSEETLKDLIDITTKEKYFGLAKDELETLKEKLAHDKDKDLKTFKDEIIEFITEEIIGRYYFQKGRIELNLKYDHEIKKAVEILENPDDYYAILNGTYKAEKEDDTEKK